MKHKIQHVIKIADDSYCLERLVELDDVYWFGKKANQASVLMAKSHFLQQSLTMWLDVRYTCV